MSTKPSNKTQEAVNSVGEEQGKFIGNRLLTEASNLRISEVSWRRQHVTGHGRVIMVWTYGNGHWIEYYKAMGSDQIMKKDRGSSPGENVGKGKWGGMA